jgi:hypothetical protein
MPILICHGNTDEEIHHGRRINPGGFFKPNKYIILKNESYRSISDNGYTKRIKKPEKLKRKQSQYIKKVTSYM